MSLLGGVEQVSLLMGMKSLNLPGKTISQGIETVSNASSLSTGDILKTNIAPTLNEIPAVSTQVSNATNPSAIGASISKITNAVGGTLKDTGKMLRDEVLPKQQTNISAKSLGKKFLSGIVFGAVVNGVKGLTKVVSGEYSATQATQYIVKDTVVGAISGAGFAAGMNLTSVALTKFGMAAGIPLSIATMVGGAVALVATSQLLKTIAPGWDI